MCEPIMTVILNLVGKVSGRLTVIRKTANRSKQGKVIWECLCSCGNTVLAVTVAITSGRTRSCGCLHKEIVKSTKTKHGLHHTPEYKTWQNIKNRCYNAKQNDYPRYGGRGITVCDEWLNSFEAFYRDMGPKPGPEYSIERKENDKGYSKENCRWATRIEQANNTRRNVFYFHNGTTKTLPAWCRELNLNYVAVEQRIRTLGWTFEEVIADAVKKY